MFLKLSILLPQVQLGWDGGGGGGGGQQASCVAAKKAVEFPQVLASLLLVFYGDLLVSCDIKD